MTSDTLLGYETRVRQYIHEPTAATSWWDTDFLRNSFNANYRKRCSQLTSAHEGYFTMEVDSPVILEEPFYAWPDGFERLIKLQLENVSTGSLRPIERWERHMSGIPKTIPTMLSYVPTYRPVGSGFLIEPAFADGVAAATVIEGFDLSAASYTASTDCAVSSVTNPLTVIEGTGAIQLDKTGTTLVTPAVYVERAASYDLSRFEQVEFWVYVPSVSASVLGSASAAVYLTIYQGASYRRFEFARSTLSPGWNHIEATLGSPTSTGGTVDLAEVTKVRIGFGVTSQSLIVYGFMVDGLRQPAPSTAPSFNLVLEYTGLPTRLSADAQTLHPDFPASFDELLVLDTAVALMAAESALEDGQVRSLLREKLDWEVTFLRYIDSRMVSTEQVEGFIPHYMDA